MSEHGTHCWKLKHGEVQLTVRWTELHLPDTSVRLVRALDLHEDLQPLQRRHCSARPVGMHNPVSRLLTTKLTASMQRHAMAWHAQTMRDSHSTGDASSGERLADRGQGQAGQLLTTKLTASMQRHAMAWHAQTMRDSHSTGDASGDERLADRGQGQAGRA